MTYCSEIMHQQTQKISELEAEIQQLKNENVIMSTENYDITRRNCELEKQVEAAKEYAARTLVEHNVSGAFVRNYIEKYGDTDEWVNIAYVKELLEILKENQLLNHIKSTEEKKNE